VEYKGEPASDPSVKSPLNNDQLQKLVCGFESLQKGPVISCGVTRRFPDMGIKHLFPYKQVPCFTFHGCAF
jgi:hypothetical protein